jgi:NAD(P)-dependent dehydrogenase (short-subunit alcohol dehydrogenase family)
LIKHAADLHQLPPTNDLLLAGGDDRLTLDAGSGRSQYGCRPTPDTDLVSLGSSTASHISPYAYQAADALRQRCAQAMRREPELVVYRRALANVRQRLLAYCGCAPEDSPMTLLAPSGTDLFMLVANLRQPQCTVLIDGAETGSGVPLALLGPRQGAPHIVAVRHADGSLRDAGEVDAEYAAIVDEAATRGQRVLLVLTDVSKTGLIAPSIASVQALRARWPDHLDVLVDACQFRLDPLTVRAYLAQGFMLALTGSKFLTGPTFSGALLLPRAMAANAVDAVTTNSNFGMLLRWEAALTEMERFAAVPQTARWHWVRHFEDVVTRGLAQNAAFTPLPVAAIDRSALGVSPGWDSVQTIFPFTLRDADGHLLDAAEARRVYLQLQLPAIGTRRYQLGQPAAAGALRLCLSARMIADLHEGVTPDIDVAAPLARIAQLLA